MRFLPRREGEIKNEVFVKPAKVKNVIPVVDRVGDIAQGETFFQNVSLHNICN